MIRIAIAAILILVVSGASAQQVDPAFLQRALTALQTQRNQALDAAAAQQARADGLAEELAKAQARIKDLEARPTEKKD